MCLIISGTSREVRGTLLDTKGMLEDVYTTNSDGVGAMYVTSKHRLRTPKRVPHNYDEVRTFIAQLPDDDRALSVHFRWRTHGATDLANCHPYTVIPGQVALMHNGILTQGNMADTSKSDTWHYIEDIVKPQLMQYPKLFLVRQWLELIENDIEYSNKFVIMDRDGEFVIANKGAGITHAGLWFSNTYAWSPEMLIPGYRKPVVYAPPKASYPYASRAMDAGADAWGPGSDYDDAELDYANRHDYASGISGDMDDVEDPFGADAISLGQAPKRVWEAMDSLDVDTVAEFLAAYPRVTLLTIMRVARFICLYNPDEMEEEDGGIVKLLVDKNVDELADAIHDDTSLADVVADIIVNYGEWVDTVPSANDADAGLSDDPDDMDDIPAQVQEAVREAVTIH